MIERACLGELALSLVGMKLPLIFRPYPMSAGALALAILTSLLFSYMFFTEDRSWFPNVLKPLLGGGMVPFYLLGTLTESGTVAMIAFWMGTIVSYLLVGLMLDGIVIALRWHRRRAVA